MAMAVILPARVIIVGQSTFFINGLAGCLCDGGHGVLGHARDLAETLKQIDTLVPNLILVGPCLPAHEGLDICRQISGRRPGLKVILMTTSAHDPLLLTDAAYSGAAACLPMSVQPEECLAAIAQVLAGRRLFSAECLNEAHTVPQPTTRRRVIVKLMADGRTEQEIARELGLSVATVHNHVHIIVKKLRVHDRHAAVERASRLGLIELGRRQDARHPQRTPA